MGFVVQMAPAVTGTTTKTRRGFSVQLHTVQIENYPIYKKYVSVNKANKIVFYRKINTFTASGQVRPASGQILPKF